MLFTLIFFGSNLKILLLYFHLIPLQNKKNYFHFKLSHINLFTEFIYYFILLLYIFSFVHFIYSLAQVTKIIFAITTWISYALQGYVTADIIWHKYLSKRVKDTSKHVLFELLIRAGIVLLTCKYYFLFY